MADEFKTMKLIKKLYEADDQIAYQGVFMCTRCHGVLIDRSGDSFTDSPANDDSQIVNWSCPLCDASAPLSRRYQMALCTVGWSCRGTRGRAKTAPLGFPSFNEGIIDVIPGCDVYISLLFDYKGNIVDASNSDISLFYQSKDKAFEDMLDGRPDQLIQKTHVDRQALARVVVQRCLNDMNLEQSREEA